MVAVAYERWSFTTGFSYKALTEKIFGVSGKVVAREGSTVLQYYVTLLYY